MLLLFTYYRLKNKSLPSQSLKKVGITFKLCIILFLFANTFNLNFHCTDAPLNSAPNVPKMQRLMLNVAEARKDPKSACLKIYSCCCGSGTQLECKAMYITHLFIIILHFVVLCGIGMLFIAVLPVAMIVIG